MAVSGMRRALVMSWDAAGITPMMSTEAPPPTLSCPPTKLAHTGAGEDVTASVQVKWGLASFVTLEIVPVITGLLALAGPAANGKPAMVAAGNTNRLAPLPVIPAIVAVVTPS